jgi:hypothetical protein
VTPDERADRIDELQKQIWRLEWALGVFRRELAELQGEPVNPRKLRLVKCPGTRTARILTRRGPFSR